MGDRECRSSDLQESSLGYHSSMQEVLTLRSKPGRGQCLVGSLTGMVASERVTEASKGSLKTVGNRLQSTKA